MSDEYKQLQKTEDGGWRWGDKGKTYYGSNARDLAVKQGLAILRAYKEIDEDGYEIFPFNAG